MLIAVLHYIPDLAQVRQIVWRLLDAVPPGSFLAISQSRGVAAAVLRFAHRFEDRNRSTACSTVGAARSGCPALTEPPAGWPRQPGPEMPSRCTG
jgi:S-adenosyl methyltransferase